MSLLAEAAILRAARFMIAGAVELDAARAAELHRVAAETMVDAAQLLSGHTGDTVPANAVVAVRDEVLVHVRDHFLGLASTIAPALVGVETEAEVERIFLEEIAHHHPSNSELRQARSRFEAPA
jgi:hypothetical protein